VLRPVIEPGRAAYIGFMLAALAVFLAARRFFPGPPTLASLPWTRRAALPLGALVGGAFGGKLPFVIGPAAVNLGWTAWVLTDGKTITTALLGAYLGVEAVKWSLGIKAKTGDTFAVPLALALAVGRWGCFFNGCCHGVATFFPWGVDFGDGVPRHPTQVYESLFHSAMAGVLLFITWRGWIPRQRVKLYLIAYGLYRFATETIRPEPSWLLGLTLYQWAALALVGAMAVHWFVDRRVSGVG
jgi:prolipoprotein diacylglyceryltransferase